ncbi:MAG: hypothetical protein JW850_23015 [Thermoflexales bacterium]|nr:hypothetical protein [Thermoflexales bacterium]
MATTKRLIRSIGCLAIISLVGLAAACANATPVPRPSPPPSIAYSLALTRTTPSGLGQIKLEDGWERLGSFRATLSLTASSPTAQNATLTVIEEQSRAHNAQRIVHTYTDLQHPEASQFSEQVQLGSSSFLASGRPGAAGQCVAQPVQQPGQWALIALPYSDLGDWKEARYVGDEIVTTAQGMAIPARHYVIERSVLGDFPGGRAELWLAADGAYVIKLQAQASGQGEFRSNPNFEGELTLHYELDQLDQAISIEPPPACTQDIPLMAGVEETTIANNMVFYKVKSTAAAVSEFYRQSMPGRGWTPIDVPASNPDVTALAFQREGQVANVLLAPIGQGNVVQVLVLTITESP